MLMKKTIVKIIAYTFTFQKHKVISYIV